MGRRAGASAILTCVVYLASLMLPGPAAAATCNPSRTRVYYGGHDGVSQSSGSSPVYIRTNLLEVDPYVSPAGSDGKEGDISAWPMLVNGSRYAQVGFLHHYGGSRVMFIQYIDDSGSMHTPTFAARTLGTYTKYEVRAITGGKSFLAAGSTLKTYTDATWAATTMQFYGETHNRNDQMPGTATSREEFSATQFSHDLRTWTYVTDASNSYNENWYGHQDVGAGVYRIWDTCHA
jgi:hypothetical protein